MILFFENKDLMVYGVETIEEFSSNDIDKLNWLFDSSNSPKKYIQGIFKSVKKEMVSPWSTNAVEITQNMGIEGIKRIELFLPYDGKGYDDLLEEIYTNTDQDIFKINIKKEDIVLVEDINDYNNKEGLALNKEEIQYLENISKKLKRKLTDSEVFGFSQINSEHCRHKIFNGDFVIDGEIKKESLFSLIKKTSKENPNEIISAYKDNVAFIKGSEITQFAPNENNIFEEKKRESIISLKAETHNFPTTVEPFNGAATGAGGEIRDRLAGGTGSLPLAGTSVYMTSYPRYEEEKRDWARENTQRNWLYKKPLDILIKASNGASDFNNKYGQPLIAGSLLTFENKEKKLGFDKVIMLAGGIGNGYLEYSKKKSPKKGDKIIILGGDNYRIGIGGSAVSSVNTGSMRKQIELNAVQRSNPEMQKRVANVIRYMIENSSNPIISIHDHGAGGHLNCLIELVEEKGGKINIDKFPIGDESLSFKEILCNESQERMGLIVKGEDIDLLKKISERERAPMYIVGEITDDLKITFHSEITGEKAIDLEINDMLGSSPKTIIEDKTIDHKFEELIYKKENIKEYIENVLSLESVACKDWLTNKTDRCVTGKVAMQQCTGELQLPLNNLGISALDYKSIKGIATSIGHAPIASIIDEKHGSINAVSECLTNLVWAPLSKGLKGVSLSANWMWPCKNEGENARLYNAVEAVSNFAIELGINIPTGKDSLSMTQNYPNNDKILSPGTVIISSVAECSDFTKTIKPILTDNNDYDIVYIDFSNDNSFELGGSSFAQTLGKIGTKVSYTKDAKYFAKTFNILQKLIKEGIITAGHDISSGGFITSILELCFSSENTGMILNLSNIDEKDSIKLLFCEKPSVIIQTNNFPELKKELEENNIKFYKIGKTCSGNLVNIKNHKDLFSLNINDLRKKWFYTSYLLDKNQTNPIDAEKRYNYFDKHVLRYEFPANFTGELPKFNNRKLMAGIIREKGSNSEREMANALYLSGFNVKDIHMTDLISGRENLEDIDFICAVGGFSNSDVLGSAKGWAGAFKFNEKAKKSLANFLNRKNTMSLGVCNGCQLFTELGIIPEARMKHNHSGKYESGFVNVYISKNTNSIMLKSLSGSRLGIWIAHGEGRFDLSKDENFYDISMKYSYSTYPANPNGSDFDAAGICTKDGRHLAMMPHLERSSFAWNWPYYHQDRHNDKVSPWITAFVNARNWIEDNKL